MNIHIHIHIDLDDRTAAPASVSATEVVPLHEPYVRVLRAVRTAQGDQLADVLEFVNASGLRIPEVLALRWSDIDLNRGTVRVERSVDGGPYGPVERLSKRPRSVRLDRRSVELLRSLASRSTGQHLLSDRSGQPYTRERVTCIWRRACQTAGVDLRLHDLRRVSPLRRAA